MARRTFDHMLRERARELTQDLREPGKRPKARREALISNMTERALYDAVLDLIPPGTLQQIYRDVEDAT